MTQKCVLLIIVHRQNVMNMTDPKVKSSASRNRTCSRTHWVCPQKLSKPRPRAERRCKPQEFAIIPVHMTPGGTAKSNCAFQQCFKHRFQVWLRINCGAADHLEYVRGGGLLLQRFTKVVCPFFDLVKKPHVFDCDHSLVSKGLQQPNMVIGKPTWLRARDIDC